jgi:hypothetical protein
MDSVRIHKLYSERRNTMIKACHEDGMRPCFGIIEILMMSGMTRKEAEMAVMVSDGLTMPQIYAAFQDCVQMHDIVSTISRYGSKKKLAGLVNNAEILILWISNMELVGK